MLVLLIWSGAIGLQFTGLHTIERGIRYETPLFVGVGADPIGVEAGGVEEKGKSGCRMSRCPGPPRGWLAYTPPPLRPRLLQLNDEQFACD